MSHPMVREIRALEELASELGPDGLDRALEAIVQAVARWSGADRASLIHFDWDTRTVGAFLRAGPGWAEILTTISFDELLSGLSGWVLRTGQVAVSSQYEFDARESPESQARRTETNCGSILVAPLGSSDKRVGTITLINRPGDADYSTDDAENLEVFAQLAGWVIRLAEERALGAKAQAEARAAIRSKTHFLSNLSHELRTPLNGVLGFSHLLAASPLEPDQKAMVQTILQSGQRLLGTVDNLLELAQFETGQFHLEFAPFSPRSVLDSVIAKHADTAAEKNLVWKISSSPDLPVVLEGDAVRIGQAWNHILANAVKFTEQGTITVTLEARKMSRGRSELILNVSDTGIGLSNERLGQWFMPFHQEDGSLTRKFGGTGLGLALCDRIVRRMGGGLSLLGEPGVGTKVRVWMDLSHEPVPRWVTPQGLRVLLQDGDPVSSLVVVKLLEKAGHRVDFVTTVVQAGERLNNNFYEVLMTEAPSSDPAGLALLKAESPNESLHLIGVYGVGSRIVDDDTVPWTTILQKPVTYTNLLAALKPCRPWEEA